MYAIIALVLVIAFMFATMGLPLRLEPLFNRVRPRLGRASQFMSMSHQAVLPSTEEAHQENMSLTKTWLLLSAVAFTLFGVADGALIQNDPQALRAVVIYSFVACGLSALVVSCIVAYKRLVSRAGIESTFRRCGFRGLCVFDSDRQPDGLVDHVETQGERTDKIRILDIFGDDLCAEVANPLYESVRRVLEARIDAPVELLLLDPCVQQRRTDGHPLTPQSTAATNSALRRIQRSLKHVERLNEERQLNAQIRVKFYAEKPTFRAVIFDDSAVVLPWRSNAKTEDLSCLEIERQSESPGLYATFRREFGRLWQSSVAQVFTS